MTKKVYIETSTVSYLTGRANRDVVLAGHQQSTQEFWELLGRGLDPYVSALVVKEASEGDPESASRRLSAIDAFLILKTTPDAEVLSEKILEAHGVPKEFPEDALHIAIAAVNGMDFMVTWNFKHINNPFTKMMIRHAVENAGYECPEMVSPEAFLGGNNE